MCRVPFLFLRSNSALAHVRSSWSLVGDFMSDGKIEAEVKCLACHGAGTAAGAQPVRSGPFLLALWGVRRHGPQAEAQQFRRMSN